MSGAAATSAAAARNVRVIATRWEKGLEQESQGQARGGKRRRPRRRRRRSQRSSAEEARSPVQEAALRIGIRELRAEQVRVIDDALAGRDVLMVLPTGFGKSACYQIPSLLLDKPVVMISPLRALLRDQEAKFAERDLPVVRIDGGVRGRNRAKAFAPVAGAGIATHSRSDRYRNS
jgi:superfamily II DNA helicase RecQ